MSSGTSLSRAVNIEDLRELARRRVPRIVFNYIDGGAEGEWTLRENRRAFETVTFRPHQAVAVQSCDLRTRVLGLELSMLLLLAPCGIFAHDAPRRRNSGCPSGGESGSWLDSVYGLRPPARRCESGFDRPVHCGSRQYTLGETLTSLGNRLDPERFVRIHRGRIVNISRLTAVHAMLGGTYEIELRSGERISSGRQYKDAIQAIIKSQS